jgi:hypothetical protein
LGQIFIKKVYWEKQRQSEGRSRNDSIQKEITALYLDQVPA